MAQLHRHKARGLWSTLRLPRGGEEGGRENARRLGACGLRRLGAVCALNSPHVDIFPVTLAGCPVESLEEMIVKQAGEPLHLDPIYETDMAESLKAMALEGHGLAFLPASSVRKDLRARRLVSAGDAGGWELTMEVRIYRERPAVARVVRPMAAALWEHLRTTTG